MCQTTVEYTLTQFRDTVGISLETHRHWKRVLPPLARRRGRAPNFTVGDLIAGAVVKRLTDVGGLRVGHLKDVADALFALCNRSQWATMASASLVLDCDRRQCEIADTTRLPNGEGLILSLPLGPVLDSIRASLLKSTSDHSQTSLRFPPVGMHTARRKVRA